MRARIDVRSPMRSAAPRCSSNPTPRVHDGDGHLAAAEAEREFRLVDAGVPGDVDEALRDRCVERGGAARAERAEHVEVAGHPHVESGVRGGGEARGSQRRRSRRPQDAARCSSRVAAAGAGAARRRRARATATGAWPWSIAQSRPTMSPRSWRMPSRRRSSTGPEPAAAMATRWLRAVSCRRAVARSS